MKKILYILAVIFLSITANSCTSDFLEETPVDNIYADNLLVKYSGFVNMQNSLYSMARNEYGRVDEEYGSADYSSLPFAKSTLFSVGADNAWGNNRHSSFCHFSYPKNIVSMTDFETFLAIFEWLYTVINTSNMIITRAENNDVDWEGGSDEEDLENKNNIVASARLFRAWAYRHLTYTFGDVPLSLEEITGSNYRTDWERTPVAEIREAMVEDLLFAIDILPMRATNNSSLSQAIARHYLGEIYLAMGENTKAKEILQPLVEGSDYSLMTSRFGTEASEDGNVFMDLFRSPLYSEGNNEVLWAFLNTESENAAYGIEENAFMRNMWQTYYSNLSEVSSLSHSQYPTTSIVLFWSLNNGKGAGRVAISLGAFDLYTYKDQEELDIRYDDHSITWDLYYLNEENEVYPLTDSEGNSIIKLEVTANMEDDSDTSIKNYYLPSTKKWAYVHPTFEQSSSDQQYNDMVYLRLAETYLLYSEALFKLNDATAVDWVNKIRTRAGVCSIDASEMSIDMILDERSRELITEEQRRHTLIRLSQENGGDERLASNVFKTRTRTYNEVSGREVRGMHDDVTPVLYPIPLTFINSNSGSVIEQNPGY